MPKSKTIIEIRSLARSHTMTALNVLVGIMRSKDATAAARVSAANAILDRGWGKATQTIETGDDGPLELIHRIEDHTADSIKSLEGFRIAWVDEAQNLSARSLALLRPTIRTAGSELWASWNVPGPGRAHCIGASRWDEAAEGRDWCMRSSCCRRCSSENTP
jgi:hypothetical protein